MWLTESIQTTWPPAHLPPPLRQRHHQRHALRPPRWRHHLRRWPATRQWRMVRRSGRLSAALWSTAPTALEPSRAVIAWASPEPAARSRGPRSSMATPPRVSSAVPAILVPRLENAAPVELLQEKSRGMGTGVRFQQLRGDNETRCGVFKVHCGLLRPFARIGGMSGWAWVCSCTNVPRFSWGPSGSTLLGPTNFLKR